MFMPASMNTSHIYMWPSNLPHLHNYCIRGREIPAGYFGETKLREQESLSRHYSDAFNDASIKSLPAQHLGPFFCFFSLSSGVLNEDLQQGDMLLFQLEWRQSRRIKPLWEENVFPARLHRRVLIRNSFAFSPVIIMTTTKSLMNKL